MKILAEVEREIKKDLRYYGNAFLHISYRYVRRVDPRDVTITVRLPRDAYEMRPNLATEIATFKKEKRKKK